MADDLGFDLDQLLAQTREPPLFNRFGYCERAKEVPEIVGECVKLQANDVGVERATRKARPLDCPFTLFYPLLARPALVVKPARSSRW